MSMSFENVCCKCGKEFDAWCIQRLCNDCVETSKIKNLPPTQIVKVTDGGGYCTGYMFAKDLELLGELDIATNDSEFKLVLNHDEIKALENHLGYEIKFEK